MNEQDVIAAYESILGCTAQMLEAARASDWERLVEVEQDCRKLVERLIADNTGQPLSGQLQQRKAEIIRKVLADDAEIRNFTQPWMAQLQNIIGSAGREQRLHRAYDPGSGG
jgi:flagellar protein FliT